MKRTWLAAMLVFTALVICQTSLAEELALDQKNSAEGCDAAPEGCDAATEGCDEAAEGCDAAPEGCDEAADETARTFEIPAWAYDRGNLKAFTSQYTGGGPMAANGGQLPNLAEYDIALPVDGVYTLHVKYTALQSRPLTLSVDGKKVGEICKSTTGSWDTSKAQWEEQCQLELTAGTHTLQMENATAYPHVMTLKFVSDTPFPSDWKLERPKAKTLAQAEKPTPVKIKPKPVDCDAIRRSVMHLAEVYPMQFDGAKYLARLDELEQQRIELRRGDDIDAMDAIEQSLRDLQREALLANPLIDFDEILLVKRNKKNLGLPRNWQSNSTLGRSGFDNEIAKLKLSDLTAPLETIYRPESGSFVGDLDLNWDADRLLLSAVGVNNRWQVCELNVDGSGFKELTGEQPDVDNYDACYLPSGQIAFTSTAIFVGVPCVYGNSHVATLYRMEADGSGIRQLCFDQEHNWCPAVMNNGQILYQRWEYSDTPHSNTRMLFHCYPDGTAQREYYGSNSYWPNSVFYAKAIPGHQSKVVAIVGGHHDNPRMGELVIFDPALGRQEADGVVQRIPGYGEKVEPIIKDGLTLASWPKFLHPYPLDENYYLVSAQMNASSNWGIYLVDTFDNMVLLSDDPDYVLFEPTPIRKTERPVVVPDRIDPNSKESTVYIADIYNGDGLKNVPRGTVKEIRVITYHFSYQNMGGLLGIVGVDGPWDIKQVLGTVPVNPDGSAKFTIPANTPVAFQPLDENGQALQLMRSWTTGMPGETMQCNGCHEPQNSAAVPKGSVALYADPAKIKPWYGPTRGFAYSREVQPIVDKYCVGCHQGAEPDENGVIEGAIASPDLRGDVFVKNYHSISPGRGTNHVQNDSHFSVGYFELQRYCRRPGIESDYHMLKPMDFHASQTELIQMLRKGHYGVELSDEAWERLITWIDLNCPYHGTWREATKDPGVQRERRTELAELYGGVRPTDPEAIYPTEIETGPFVMPRWEPKPAGDVGPVANWPFDASQAIDRQQSLGVVSEKIELGDGVTMSMVHIPSGEFVIGSTDGSEDERPRQVASIDRPFWIGSYEVTNAQFAQFAPQHDSRVESKHSYQFGVHGYPLNEPQQPVCRVTWQQAMAFCEWLSAKTGRNFTLPTETQWEYAARSGADTPFWFGDTDSDFSTFANMADARLTGFVTNPYTITQELPNPPIFDDWIPKDTRFNDGAILSVAPGSYAPNPWGLYDMHGNVAEWTRSDYTLSPSPGMTAAPTAKKVVRGGSWRDRPARCTSSYRIGYQPYQPVFNVGFRVVCEEPVP